MSVFGMSMHGQKYVLDAEEYCVQRGLRVKLIGLIQENRH